MLIGLSFQASGSRGILMLIGLSFQASGSFRRVAAEGYSC